MATRRLRLREHAGFLRAAPEEEAGPDRGLRTAVDSTRRRVSMGLTGFRSRVVGLTTLVSVLVVSASVVLTQLLMARATDADARALAHTRAHAVAATVTLRSGQVRAIEGPPDTLDAVAWVYADD